MKANFEMLCQFIPGVSPKKKRTEKNIMQSTYNQKKPQHFCYAMAKTGQPKIYFVTRF